MFHLNNGQPYITNKEDPSSAVVIEQAEEGKSIAMFSNPKVRPLIEEAGHIYDSTVITSYLQS